MTLPARILMAVTLLLPTASLAGDDLPDRAPGLWELVKNVAGDPRRLPAVRQCTDAQTDRLLGARAFLASTDPCSRLDVARSGSTWRIDAVCESMAGPMRERTELSGDFQRTYQMVQQATVAGAKVTQTVVATRIGSCAADQKPGMVYVNGMPFDLQATGE